MPDKRTTKRQRLFNRGVAAFIRARPEAPHLYCCPLCLRGWEDPAALTFEDVPPKSIGGKPIVLTCWECNNSSGRVLDPNIRIGRDFAEIAQGSRQLWVRLSEGKHTITAKATFADGGMQFFGMPEHSNPADHRGFFETLQQASETGSTDWGISMSFSSRHNPWREAVGWLRVAYLYAFAALGYTFILRPELDGVRDQIRRPDERILPQAMKHTGGASGDGLSFVHAPVELQAVVVRLGVNLFWFPGVWEPGTFYDRLADYPATGQNLTLSGIHMDLPTGPRFEFDFHSRSVLLMFPPGERSTQS